jgi:hypothetical protein
VQESEYANIWLSERSNLFSFFVAELKKKCTFAPSK